VSEETVTRELPVAPLAPAAPAAPAAVVVPVTTAAPVTPAALVTDHPTHPGLPPAVDRPAWAPYSPCGAECLPPLGPAAVFRTARRCVALVVLLLLAPALLLVGARTALHRAMLRAAGIRLRVEGGTYRRGGSLVVANHMSWIDVLALGAVAPVRMVAKREVGDWPLVGALARRCGALFVDRAGLRGLPAVVARTADALRAGATVGVFPEGTTWCGSAAGPFRRAPFQAALDARVPVRPVRIALTGPDGRPTTAGAFVGPATLWDSMSRVLRMPRLDCTLTLLPELAPAGDRRALAARAERAVTAA
jgi:1-acyl-sn-glycerol-3-phosphate acyltransferase